MLQLARAKERKMRPLQMNTQTGGESIIFILLLLSTTFAAVEMKQQKLEVRKLNAAKKRTNN